MAEIAGLEAPVTITSGNYAGQFTFPKVKYSGGYKLTSQTFVDAGRNIKGEVIGAVISGADAVRRIDMTFAFVTPEQWHGIMKLFDIAQGGSYVNEFSYWDDGVGDFVRGRFYHGDMTTGEAIGGNPNHPIGIKGYLNATLSLIAVKGMVL